MSHWSIVEAKSGNVFKHTCTKCKNTTLIMCADQPVKAFCCGQWVTPPKETFWNKLPREQAPPERKYRTLPSSVEEEVQV
jgi:hypothetical protein